MPVTDTPDSDAEAIEFVPTNDPRYEGPCEWVPLSTAREIERERNDIMIMRKLDARLRDELRIEIAKKQRLWDNLMSAMTVERKEFSRILHELREENRSLDEAMQTVYESRTTVCKRWAGLNYALHKISLLPSGSDSTTSIANAALAEFGRHVIETPSNG